MKKRSLMDTVMLWIKFISAVFPDIRDKYNEIFKQDEPHTTEVIEPLAEDTESQISHQE